jgi:glycosyltransferase involved in cell wall biosynthesis
MEKDLVSILMTAFNREEYIQEAIESVLGSSYSNFELIIVDDCSSDMTVAIARKFEVQDNRVKLYLNEKNLGDYANRNRAASYASGEYLMYVDSDDKIFVNGIENTLRLMQTYPHSSFGMRLFDKPCDPFELDSQQAIYKHFFQEPFLNIGPGGTIIKRSFFEDINGYPVKYGPANDMYFNLMAVCFSTIVMIPFEFLFYRRHAGQEINNKQSYLYNNYLFMRDALDELPLGLPPEKIKWLNLKNKRRFFVNVVKYFTTTLNVKKTVSFLKLTKFSVKDAFASIFH